MPFVRKRAFDEESSSSSDNVAKAAKVEIPIPSANLKGKMSSSTSQSQNVEPTLKKPKPISINEHVSKVKQIISGLVLEKKPTITYRGIDNNNTPNTRIAPLTMKDKQTIMNELKKQKIPHHSWTDAVNKLPTYVLKHHYHESNAQMAILLKAENLPVTSVSLIGKNVSNPVYVVQFSDVKVNLPKLNESFSQIDGLSIKWETLKPSKKKFTQCFNCQRWGHSSKNCGYSFRCVACGSADHGPAQCPRKDFTKDVREKENLPTCCNCGENHSASFKQCKAFKDYAGGVKKSQVRHAAAHQPTHQSTPFIFEHQMFPEVPVSSSSSAPPKGRPVIDRSNLKNIVNPPKPRFFDTQQPPNIPQSHQSYRDKFVQGESQSRSQPSNQCQNCKIMLQRLDQMQQQILNLTSLLNQFMSSPPPAQSWI